MSHQRTRIVLTGAPGSGKTTVAAAVVDAARARGWRVAVDIAAVGDIARSFERSIARSTLVVLDEIGKMELLSTEFVRAVEAAFAADKPMLAVVHRSQARRYATRGELIQVNARNRGALATGVLSKLAASVKPSR